MVERVNGSAIFDPSGHGAGSLSAINREAAGSIPVLSRVKRAGTKADGYLAMTAVRHQLDRPLKTRRARYEAGGLSTCTRTTPSRIP